ncbi:hypothetical protein ACFLY7_01520 [Patescibacteria group bacterium]
MTEENQKVEEQNLNTEPVADVKIPTEENPVSAEPKQEVVESVPVIEETSQIETQSVSVEQNEIPTEQVEIPEVEVVEPIIEKVEEIPVVETTENEQPINENAGLPRSEELAETTIEETPPIAPTQEIEPQQVVEPTQTQEIPTQPEIPNLSTANEQIKTVEKIIYQTPPNFIQNLLNKARAKIQERKRKKLDKIMLLLETKLQIRNKDVQKLLFAKKRTVTNYLNQLEQEQKIIQIGKKGNEVFYIKKV